MSDLKRFAKTYRCIRGYTSRHDIREPNIVPTGIARKIDEVSKWYKLQHTMYSELSEKGEHIKARTIPLEYVSALDHYSLNRNGEVFSPQDRKNSECCDAYLPLFTVEPLHRLHLSISLRMKECTVGYLSLTDRKDLLAHINIRQ